jgi:hypothetical protein
MANEYYGLRVGKQPLLAVHYVYGLSNGAISDIMNNFFHLTVITEVIDKDKENQRIKIKNSAMGIWGSTYSYIGNETTARDQALEFGVIANHFENTFSGSYWAFKRCRRL